MSSPKLGDTGILAGDHTAGCINPLPRAEPGIDPEALLTTGDNMATSEATPQVPPALAEIANGRDHILTPEFCHAIQRKAQTVRKQHAVCGHAFGIKPVKIGNRLLWPVAQVAALLAGGAK